MLLSENVVLNMLAKCSKESILALADKYCISPHDVLTSSVTFMKGRFWFYCADLV